MPKKYLHKKSPFVAVFTGTSLKSTFGWILGRICLSIESAPRLLGLSTYDQPWNTSTGENRTLAIRRCGVHRSSTLLLHCLIIAYRLITGGGGFFPSLAVRPPVTSSGCLACQCKGHPSRLILLSRSSDTRLMDDLSTPPPIPPGATPPLPRGGVSGAPGDVRVGVGGGPPPVCGRVIAPSPVALCWFWPQITIGESPISGKGVREEEKEVEW